MTISTHLAQHRRTAPVAWHDPRRAVVVGVDESEGSRAAVDHAAAWAAATGRPLTLLAVLDDLPVRIPHHVPSAPPQDAFALIGEHTRRLRRAHPDLVIRRELELGGTVDRLLDRSVEQAMLVVGKRGLGAVGRWVLGSTSIGVAGRSRVPVLVVPAGWDAAAHEDGPVVVANAPKNVLAEAQAVAARYGVPVRRVLPSDGPGPYASLLLSAARDARLLVLARYGGDVPLGFPAGSVDRAVLRRSDVPVLIVPVE